MRKPAPKSALYTGTVMHARRSPRDNVFRYPVYMALIDLDELPRLDRTPAPVRVEPARRHELPRPDHIDIHDILAANGVDLGPGGSIRC